MALASWSMRLLLIGLSIADWSVAGYFAAAGAATNTACEPPASIFNSASGNYSAYAEAEVSCYDAFCSQAGTAGAWALAENLSIRVSNSSDPIDPPLIESYAYATFEVTLHAVGYSRLGYLHYEAIIGRSGDAGSASLELYSLTMGMLPIDWNTGPLMILVDFSAPLIATGGAGTTPSNGHISAFFRFSGISDLDMNLIEGAKLVELPEPSPAWMVGFTLVGLLGLGVVRRRTSEFLLTRRDYRCQPAQFSDHPAGGPNQPLL